MTYAADNFGTLPKMPSWVTSGRTETSEDVAFLSAVALAHLHIVLSQPEVPQDLLRALFALRAAEVCVTHQGRPERASELRDAAAFLQPCDSAGPAGDVYLKWGRAVERPVSVKTLYRALPEIDADQIAMFLDAGQGAPVARAASVLQAVIEDRPRDYAASLLLADAALAQALGWSHALPLLAPGLKRADLRKTGADQQLACHRAIVSAATEAVQAAGDLARRAERLRSVAPMLRARGSEEAVALFLSRAAVAPAALASLRSGRAARRFYDRLVELGAVRELTGRDTFRLYGI